MSIQTVPGVAILGAVTAEQTEVLTPAAQQFVATLHRCFNARRKQLLAARVERQKEFDAGRLPDFLPETRAIREDVAWKGAAPAPGMADRRVEITGPVDRKMVINALNSGAATFMADFEDSHCPTWSQNLDGHINLRDALRRTITFKAPNGKYYKLRDDGKVATLLVRPRGWHLEEAHFTVDGERTSGSLFDFGLYFFHCARLSIAAGQGPYFYLPKMEDHLEARLWNDVFNLAQDMMGIPRGTIRGTVLIETFPAAFQMEEIIYELRDHSSGLNCGRWDYIFSFIKKLRAHSKYMLPERSEITMTSGFMAAYVALLIKTCHKRGVHAMGGMAAQIPIKDNKAANDAAMAKVRNDKLREVNAGHDGTWVAHPDLVKIALEIFDKGMPQANQLHVLREDVNVTADDLRSLKGLSDKITDAGLRNNIDVSLAYTEAWLSGNGCVPIHNLMEDAATAEISRSQVWQWVRHSARTKEGNTITADYVNQVLREEVEKRRAALGAKFASTRFELAAKLLSNTMTGGAYDDFLTTMCYDHVLTIKGSAKL